MLILERFRVAHTDIHVLRSACGHAIAVSSSSLTGTAIVFISVLLFLKSHQHTQAQHQ
jgi:hypothetical protein